MSKGSENTTKETTREETQNAEVAHNREEAQNAEDVIDYHGAIRHKEERLLLQG